MPQLAVLLMVVVIGTWLFLKLKKSKVVDTIAYDLTHDEPSKGSKTSDLISDAQEADGALVDRVETNKAAIAKITSETETIKEYRKPVEPVSVEEVKAENEEDADKQTE